MSDFVHLHMHSEYSLLDGINRIETLPKFIKDMGQTSVALTDHGTVSGAYSFFKSCTSEGIKPIIGMEAYYCVEDRTVREKDDLGSPYYHLVLLAKNNNGLKNLFKLSSFAYTEGFYHKPRIDDQLLADYGEDILATSACLGSRASQLILNDRVKEAEMILEHHAAIFKDRFFIEVQLHVMDEQAKVNAVLVALANKHNWPLVLTNDCHYTEQHDKMLHEIVLCMQTGKKINDEDRFSFGEIDVHVGHYDWMKKQANRLGIPYEAISNTVHISNMIENDYFSDRKNHYPHFKNLPPGVTAPEALANLSKSMLVDRLGGLPPQEYRDRLYHELKVIKMMGYSDYFLIQWEFVEGARSKGVEVGPGRGSAAGSLVAYALGITQIDPIKYGLVFERFLNSGRGARSLIFDNKAQQLIRELDL